MSFAVFIDDKRLPAPFCKPYPDELLSSWLMRMAFYQGLSTHELDRLIWARNPHSLDIDQFITDRRLQILAEKTGCSFEELHTASLRSYNLVGCKSMITAPVLEVHTYYDQDKKQECTRLFYRSGLMFCPNCLKKNNYFKKEWRLTISVACIACKCYLRDRCPHCMRQYDLMKEPNAYAQCNSLSEFLTACRYCNKDITECSTIFAEQSVITLQHQLYAVLETTNEAESSKCSYFKVLLDLASFLQIDITRANKINSFVRNIIELNSFSAKRLGNYKEKPAKLSPERRAPFIFMAYWLMTGWPYRLLGLCMEYRLHWRDILPKIMSETASLRDPLVDDLAYRIEEMGEIIDPQALTEGDVSNQCRRTKQPPKLDYHYDFDFHDYYYDS